LRPGHGALRRFLRDLLGSGDVRLRRLLGDCRQGITVSLHAGHLDPEDVREVSGCNRFLTTRLALTDRSAVNGSRDQLQVINLAEHEEQLRLLVEARADTVHDSGNMLAYTGPVGA